MHLVGIHISKTHPISTGRPAKSLAEAIEADMDYLAGYGCGRVAQVFVRGPRDSHVVVESAEERARIRRIVEARKMRLVAHGAYVDHPWGRAEGFTAADNIRGEMKIAHEIGAMGVIVHLGKKTLDPQLCDVLRGLADLPPAVLRTTTLWLETHAAKPDGETTYDDPRRIVQLRERISQCGDLGLRIGICIDIAHLFSSGYSFRTRAAAKSWLAAAFPAGSDLPPIMFHLNDSASKLASGKDIHAPLCAGNIWRDYHPARGKLPFGDSGLAYVLEWAVSRDIPMILERSADAVMDDIELLRGVMPGANQN